MKFIKAVFPAILAGLVIALAVISGVAVAQSNDTTFDTVQLDGLLRLSPQTATVTTSFVITPVRSNIVLSSTGAATSSTTTGIITTTAKAGNIVILRNSNASAALVLDGTGGTIECGANISLGAQDSVWLMYDGSSKVWRCIALRDN